ncbi:hypothetical protein RJ639_045662 [Escallonia herrerae]|uniref:RRM domain-containing protein n=1 Tax=Escallonia herrerae TaxID=1293975 RepID=A0AA88W8E6_9ASTE|nr:hypothetical protein RJ639_045662 [Escallonia herrerae]
MAMKVASTGAAAAGSRGLRGLFSTFSSSSTFPFATPPSKADKPPAAEPSTNLFVSGTILPECSTLIQLKEPKESHSNKMSFSFSHRPTGGLANVQLQKDFEMRLRTKVVTDRGTNYSKGFGFVRYTTIEEAAAGIKGMDGSASFFKVVPAPHYVMKMPRKSRNYLDGWVIFAEYARPREPPPPLQNYGSQYGHR